MGKKIKQINLLLCFALLFARAECLASCEELIRRLNLQPKHLEAISRYGDLLSTSPKTESITASAMVAALRAKVRHQIIEAFKKHDISLASSDLEMLVEGFVKRGAGDDGRSKTLAEEEIAELKTYSYINHHDEHFGKPPQEGTTSLVVKKVRTWKQWLQKKEPHYEVIARKVDKKSNRLALKSNKIIEHDKEIIEKGIRWGQNGLIAIPFEDDYVGTKVISYKIVRIDPRTNAVEDYGTLPNVITLYNGGSDPVQWLPGGDLITIGNWGGSTHFINRWKLGKGLDPKVGFTTKVEANAVGFMNPNLIHDEDLYLPLTFHSGKPFTLARINLTSGAVQRTTLEVTPNKYSVGPRGELAFFSHDGLRIIDPMNESEPIFVDKNAREGASWSEFGVLAYFSGNSLKTVKRSIQSGKMEVVDAKQYNFSGVIGSRGISWNGANLAYISDSWDANRGTFSSLLVHSVDDKGKIQDPARITFQAGRGHSSPRWVQDSVLELRYWNSRSGKENYAYFELKDNQLRQINRVPNVLKKEVHSAWGPR